ncbi:mitochondrial DNA-directed RNA polymerase-like protein [Xylogone sp. PMI_703]|nr:mitochondrial DNA-directed RNA polymerase-like protein [Xylogone sp. PMI_703]
MLIRAAGRASRTRHGAIRNGLASEQLNLPWLCPAYKISLKDQRRVFTVDHNSQGPELRKRRNSNDGGNKLPRRSLATALGHRSFDDIPFAGVNDHSRASNLPEYGGLASLSHLRPFEASAPLVLGESVATAPPKYRMNRDGIGGELSEILSIFYACIHIGRIQRAGIILKRLIALEALESEDLLILHNRYLKAAVEQLIVKPSESSAQALHKWFELEIHHQCSTNAETIAYMLKASLQTPPGARRERLVRRYMDMVQGDAGLEVFGLDILTAAELNDINHICPTYNLTEGLEGSMLEEESVTDPNTSSLLDMKEVIGEEPLDAVREQPQRGLGLKTLKKTLSLFSDSEIDTRSLSAEERRLLQEKLEGDSVNAALDRWREENAQLTKFGMNTSLETKSLGARMWKWQTALEQQLKDEFDKISEAEAKEKKSTADNERCTYGPFLRYLPVEKLAAVTILSAMQCFGYNGPDRGITLAHVILTIAKNVEEESFCEITAKEQKDLWQQTKKSTSRTRLSRELRRRLAEPKTSDTDATLSSNESLDSLKTQWPISIRAKIGAVLMSALVDTAKIPVTREHPETKELVTQMQPAFSHAHQYKRGKKVGVILANPSLARQLQREPVHSLLAKHLPMLVEPEPWSGFNKGGFLSHPAKVMRIKLGDKSQRHYAEAAIANGNMEQTFKGLDVLGKTPWQINKPVFRTMLEAWNSGEAIANIAPAEPKIEIPPEPDASTDPTERRRWIRAVKLAENEKSGAHSERCFQNFQLEIARALLDHTFYFPHNIDFRGRAYPIPPLLNHMGADHCRGLLMFGKGRELGDSGLKWLKVHLANVYGFDKASLKEREAFATEHLTDIYDSATNPLGGKRWWLSAEDPWQCLATCIELKDALDSPDPTKFVSHLPVHQDGTCNGLQHYAALGGDVWGAKQVNLEPGDRPADVYSAVANLVKESVAEDLKRADPRAVLLDGKITRKVVKQTVMTNVYGVTFIGANAQVQKQLIAAYPDLPDTPEMNPGILSKYVARKIFTALSTMFRGAHDIQYWLGECAGRITTSVTPEQIFRIQRDLELLAAESNSVKKSKSKSPQAAVEDLAQFKSSVIWTNPLHMPIVQPYRTSKSKVVTTHLQRISLSEPHRSDPVSKRKQLQGFPPNFIHSLDATHMLLSALRCDELGLSFAAVHDSFWTHAADIDAMNGVLRDAFIQIHSEDVIGRLAEEFNARYRDCMYLAKVKPGTQLHKEIASFRRSEGKRGLRTGASSKNAQRFSELITEVQRVQLLRSSDPKEVEMGRNMVTPGSLYEKFASNDDLTVDEELSNIGLGEMPAKEAQADQDPEAALDLELDPSMELDDFQETEEKSDLHTIDDAAEAAESEQSNFEKSIAKQKQSSAGRSALWVWLPLTFPPVPKKGEFDVSRLKNSAYFFS